MDEANAILLPYQQRWIEDRSTIKVIEKSRRIGLSWAEAADAVLTCSAVDGMNVYYIGYNEDMTRGFMSDCAFWIKHFNRVAATMQEVLVKDEDRDIKTFRIQMASGFEISALSSKPTNLRSKQGKVIIDEAAFVPDLPGLLKAAIALLMWGGQLSIISTHNGLDNPFNSLVNDIRAGRKGYSLHRVTLDDALADGLYKRICRVNDKKWSLEKELEWRQELFEDYGDMAEEELLCIPRSSVEVYMPRPLIEARMRSEYVVVRWSQENEFAERPEYERRHICKLWLEESVLPILKVLPSLPAYIGMDFGRFHDLSVIALILEGQDLNRYSPLVIELSNIPLRQQEQILSFLVENVDRFAGMSLDAGGNGLGIAEFAKDKWGESRVELVSLITKIYMEVFPKYKAALEDGQFLMPRDADILRDHEMVKLIDGVPRIPPGVRIKDNQRLKRRHGDTVIALVLGLMAALNHPMSAIRREQMGTAKAMPGCRSDIRDSFNAAGTVLSSSRRGVRSWFAD